MKIYEICFSPTGGTKKVTNILTQSCGDEIFPIDLTDSEQDFSSITFDKNDIVFFSVPSYGGRVPAPAVERLLRLRGNGATAILVCVYGNRAYEDTLVELRDTVTQAGFHVISAVAAIAEHSIAHEFASGRPDDLDAEELRSFARQIRKKITDQDFSEPKIPGNRPYKTSAGSGMVPTATKACVNCGECARGCPVQAIEKNNPREVDGKKCISCMRCIAICPHNARKVNKLLLSAVHLALKKVCSNRKENELFL